MYLPPEVEILVPSDLDADITVNERSDIIQLLNILFFKNNRVRHEIRKHGCIEMSDTNKGTYPIRLLVTGGCGFIGSNFINWVSEIYPDATIINLDCMNYCARKDNVERKGQNYTLIESKIQEPGVVSKILNKYMITHVVHFAAQSHVDASFINTGLFVDDNIIATHTLLEACKEYAKLELFVCVSTDEVYGDSNLGIGECKTEKSNLNPTNPYAATKAASEMLALSYYYSFKLPVIITRSNNVYGRNQYNEKLIPKFISLLKAGKKCTIHGDGSYTRSFIHTYDVCTALDTIIQKGVIGEIYNIGSKNEYTVIQIATKLINAIHQGENVSDWLEYVPDRFFNDTRYQICFDKLCSLGWKEVIDFDKGLLDLVI
jgi:dTDP-glucose 4,6-dehydratase